MKKLLHIKAAPREDESRTLKVASAFLDAFRRTHPDWVVEEFDLFKEDLPPLARKRVDGRYALMDGHDLYGSVKESWQEILGHIERFLSADGYLISAPMWNFSIPYRLKHYIDMIVQPRHLFRYTPEGEAEGLVTNRKMVVVTSRGGTYMAKGESPWDHQEPYLRTIFGFVGITDIAFVIAQPMDGVSDEERAASLLDAKARAAAAAEGF